MRKGAKKALSVTVGIFVALFLLLAAMSLAVTIFYSVKGEDATLFGVQLRIVLSGSMEPEIDEGELIAVKVPGDSDKTFYEELEVGDVLSFYYIKPDDRVRVVVTHKIVVIEKVSTGYRYTMQGVAVDDDTQIITSGSGDIIGKVVWHSKFLGGFVRFVRSKAGIVFCMIIPALAVAVYESIRIAGLVREGRAEKAAERKKTAQEKDEEIETLRREIERLKKGRDNGDE